MKKMFIIIAAFFLLTGFMPENSRIGFRIYPNPVTEDAINIQANEDFMQVDILNVVGQVIYTEKTEPSNSMRLDVALQPGIYFVRLTFTSRVSNVERIWVN